MKLLAAAAVALMLATGSAHGDTTKMNCEYRWYRGDAPPSTQAVYRMGTCFARRFHLSPVRTRGTLRCESHGYPYAHRDGSRFYGPLQIGWDPQSPRGTEFYEWWGDVEGWAQVRRPDPGPFNARASLIAGLWHAAHDGWGAWSSCA